MNAQKILLPLLLLMSNFVFSQTPQAFEAAAEKAYANGDYYSAMKYLERSLEMEPENTQTRFRLGESAEAFEAYQVAEVSYAQVVSDGKGAYPDAVLGLGKAKQALGKYEDAYQNFKAYLEMPSADLGKKGVAAKGMEDCEWALEEYNRPNSGVIIERLPDGINTPNSEFGALVHNDTLYFSSFKEEKWGDKHYPERPIVRILSKDKNENIEPKMIALNSAKRHTAHNTFLPGSNLFVFNLCDYVDIADIQCELFMATKLSNDFSGPVSLPLNVKGKTNTQPAFGRTVNGEHCLYFVSDREGGKGGLDIWYSVVNEHGEFGEVKNLTELNTDKDDITPFYDFEQDILYFSTTGRRTLGGFDIYFSKIKNGTYGTPDHLDIPMNSSGNDIYFSTDGAGDFYFSSNRKGSMEFNEDVCCYDIYKGEYLDLLLETFAFEKNTGEALDQVVYSINEVQTPTDVLSKFSGTAVMSDFDVDRDKEYQVIASKDGYNPDTITVKTSVIPENRKFVGKLRLEPSDLFLQVLTYNQIGNTPLPGVKIRLIEMEGLVKEEALTEDGDDKNKKELKVNVETPYLIVGTLEGYHSDSVLVSASELQPGAKLTKNLFLTPGTMGGLLPVALYFDNDEPDKRTTKEVTTISYDEAYERYFARKTEFVQRFTKGMTYEDSLRSADALAGFFEHDVRGGFLKLENFADHLDVFLENGYEVEVMVKGFASPLANQDYNMALTKRRIVSVLNYFRKVRGGLYGSYLANGQFKVSEAPFGETQAPMGISDNRTDRKQSVFSLEASKERRAEIIEIRLTRNRNLTK